MPDDKLPRILGKLQKDTTGETNGHTHEWNPGDRFTGPPNNEPEGHRHPVEPGATSTGDAEGHTHRL